MVPPVGQPVPTKPFGHVPDWVATTICASSRSVMLWFAAKVSASAPIWALLAWSGGMPVSLKAPANTVPENAAEPVLSAYGEVIVDQLSFGWTPSPEKKLFRYAALASWPESVCQFGPHSSKYTCGLCCTGPVCQVTGQFGSVHDAAALAARWCLTPAGCTIPEILPGLTWLSRASNARCRLITRTPGRWPVGCACAVAAAVTPSRLIAAAAATAKIRLSIGTPLCGQMAGHAAARHSLATGMVLPGHVITQYAPQNVTSASKSVTSRSRRQ